MTSWYLSNLHHKTVAHNFNQIFFDQAEVQHSALEIAIERLSPYHQEQLFEIGELFLSNPNVLNLNKIKWSKLDLENKFAISMQAMNYLCYKDDHPNEVIEPVDLNIFLNTSPFQLSNADLYTALSSTHTHVKNPTHEWILSKVLQTLKTVIYAKNAGITNYDDYLSEYSPVVVLSPKTVITAFRMSNAFMLKKPVSKSGQENKSVKESALQQVYADLLKEVVAATHQESGIDSENNQPIYSIAELNPEQHIAQIISEMKFYDTADEKIWLQGIKAKPFLECLSFLALREIGFPETQIRKIILSSKSNPLNLHPVPVMSENNYRGVYQNILLINAIYEQLKFANRKLTEKIMKPLIDHIDQNYLLAPDNKPKDILAKFSLRKSIGNPIHAGYFGEYRTVRYGM